MTPKEALKERVLKKSTKTESQALSVHDLRLALEKQQARSENLLQENERLRAEIERLSAENEQLTRKVNLRKEQNKAASAKRRAKDRDAYNTYERERRSAKTKSEE